MKLIKNRTENTTITRKKNQTKTQQENFLLGSGFYFVGFLLGHFCWVLLGIFCWVADPSENLQNKRQKRELW